MKLFQDYKKQFRYLLVAVLLLLPLIFSHGQSVGDIKNQIEQKNEDIAALEREIASYQGQLDTLGKQKSSLSTSIQQLDITKKKLNADISVTQKKIDRTNLTIENLSSDIGDKESSIQNNINSIKLEIRNTNEFEQKSLVENVLSNTDFTTVWNDIDNIMAVRDRLREGITTLKETKVELEDTRTETISAKEELVKLKTQLSDQQKIVVQNTNEKNKLLAQTKNSEANYQKLLADRIAKRDAFEKELRDYEAQLQYILDPTKLPAGRVLSWPLQQVYVTQLFGKTVDSVRLYASGTHNGVDFRAAVGTPVMSMADGKVLGVGDTDLTCPGASFGRYVFIQYTNGLSSTFGHLSLIKVHEGEKVNRGEVVAYSGATGHVTGPHLHVSLYASDAVKMDSKPSAACGGKIYRLPVSPINAYLDALKYLPPYTVSSGGLNNRPGE
jgi:murein DD-endopeptidase MepM/ murein hydrolase activator NlpD